MDYLIHSLISAADYRGTHLDPLCSYWVWVFWAGLVLGFVGIIIGFFMKDDS